jgi:hypothetical protein
MFGAASTPDRNITGGGKFGDNSHVLQYVFPVVTMMIVGPRRHIDKK